MTPTSKYYPLYDYLRQQDTDLVSLTIADVHNLLGGQLPPSARTQRAWWSNRRTSAVQSAAWLSAGYRVDELELNTGLIVFRKQGSIAIPAHRREGSVVLWNSSMIKALREYMGLTQSEFAQELGIRQPTVSEWETGAYEPKRSSSVLLSMVADRAGFSYT